MMKKLLDIDGPFLGFMNRMSQLIVVSFLWLVGCIPIVTVCTSCAALYASVWEAVRNGQGSAVKIFWKTYRDNLLVGSAITLTIAAAGAALLSGAWLLTGSVQPTGVTGVGAVLLTFVFLYVGPVLSRFRIGFSGTLKLAFVMSLQYAHYTLVFLLGPVVLAGLQLYVFPVAMILILPGAWCFAVTFLMERVLERYTRRPVDRDETENA